MNDKWTLTYNRYHPEKAREEVVSIHQLRDLEDCRRRLSRETPKAGVVITGSAYALDPDGTIHYLDPAS